MTYLVKTANEGYQWFLRGTTWTSDRERANVFASRVDALAALNKCRPFCKPAIWKKAVIVTV